MTEEIVINYDKNKNKTWWGLNEYDVNRFWKSYEDHYKKNCVYLSLVVDLSTYDDHNIKQLYNNYVNNIKIRFPNFKYTDLVELSDDYERFINQDKYNEYVDFIVYYKEEEEDKPVVVEESVVEQVIN